MSPSRRKPLIPHSTRTTPPPSPTPQYIAQPDGLLTPDGVVASIGAVGLLDELVHPHASGEQTEAEMEHEGGKDRRPWWRKPSPWWLLAMVPFTSIAMASTIAPRIEIYTTLACQAHKPDIYNDTHHNLFLLDTSPRGVLSSLDGNVLSPPTKPVTALNLLLATEGHEYQNPNPCAADPVVQAAVARLVAVMTVGMGVLACLTTGWWGAFSDRHGRTRLLGMSVIGLLSTDLNFIFVSMFWRRLPGGYWFLVVGPLIEGSLGGMASSMAAMQAYMADVTTEAMRSRFLSLSLGLFFVGLGVGPTLGALLIRFTRSTISVFYAAVVLHSLYALLVWFFIPESLGEASLHRARTQYNDELINTARDRELNPATTFLVKSKRLFTFLKPLGLFMPHIQEARSSSTRPRWDWNLTFLALAYGFGVSVVGSYLYVLQYAASVLGWSPETLGYWLSLVGVSRAVFLASILPVAIKVFQPKLPSMSDPRETDPLVSPTYSNERGSTATSSRTKKKAPHSLRFDLGLARFSLVADVFAFGLIGVVPTPATFMAFGVLGAVGSGFGPAMQSVTLSMYKRGGGTETGKLFGALSVVQALSGQILGPAFYGLVYERTVANYPRAIFFVAIGCFAISFVLLACVRLREPATHTTFGDAEE